MSAITFPQGDSAAERFVHRLEEMGKRPRRSGAGWQALCPAHDDRNPSLSISTAEGKVLVTCHAGCGAEAVVSSMNLTMADLFDAPAMGRRQGAGALRNEKVANYTYLDEAGNPVSETIRHFPKRFTQRYWVEGRWEWKKPPGFTLIPFQLREALNVGDNGEPLFFCEGEADVHQLENWALAATTNPMGAGKWHDSYSRLLNRTRLAVILPDNDDPGRKHAREVAASLMRAGCRDVRILELPGLAAKGDVSDWIAAGNSRESLLTLVDQAVPVTLEVLGEHSARSIHFGAPDGHAISGTVPDKEAAVDGAVPQREQDFRDTDIGNAERLVAWHGEDLRYVRGMKSWMHWDGRTWDTDGGSEAERRAKRTVRRVLVEASKVDDPARRQAMTRWSNQSENDQRIRAMLNRASVEPGIEVKVDQLDADPWRLVALNGVVDLRTGALLPHDRAALETRVAPADYDPNAHSELWDSFLVQTLPDEGSREFLQRAAGYSLTGDTREEVLFFIHGPTRSGKSTFAEAFKATLGDYAKTADFDTFLKQRAEGGPRNDIASLVGRRMVLSLEVEDGRSLAVALVKLLTGGDTVSSRFLYKEAFDFKPVMKLWLVANHKPRANADDDAIWERMRVIPFTNTVPTERRDRGLKLRLTTDPQIRSAILTWAVRGCLAWQKEGLNPPAEVQGATAAYREECEHAAAFVEDCLVAAAGARTSAKAVRQSYEAWCEANGEHAVGPKKLAAELERHGFKKGVRISGGGRAWEGFSLRNPE